jgi:hypothetical protein
MEKTYMSWIRVNRNKPCPICQKSDWCAVSDDGAVVYCMREPSDKECKSGGWIHTINANFVHRVKNVFKHQPKKKVVSPIFWDTYINDCMKNMDAEKYKFLLNELGLKNFSTLRCMLLGYDPTRKAYVVPMWDGTGRMIGMRLRSGKNKWSVKDSASGIFWPVNVLKTAEDTLLICEGWTDTATALEMGFDAIGRPSCSGGIDHIKYFLKGNKRNVVIISDNDAPKRRRDGSEWFPGQEGAMRLADAISSTVASVSVIKPPVKDLREWYNAGCCANDIWDLMERKCTEEKESRNETN